MTRLASGAVIGGVRIDRQLGQGGMGTVHLGHQVTLGRPVAVKVVRDTLAEDDEFRARFLREAQLAASLDHPNIVPVYDAGEDDGRLYVVMRYLDGFDLGAALSRHGALPPLQAARMVEQVGEALDAAHARGLVHRDVKPSNIMLVGSGADTRAYLTDFGLSKVINGIESITATGVVLGTADYMAPEQFEGVNVDGRADTYALGCVLYEALTGSPPFSSGEGFVGRMYAHLMQPVPKPTAARRDLPRALDAVVAMAMAKDPAHRYASSSGVGAAALQASSYGQSEASRGVGPDENQRVNDGERPAGGSIIREGETTRMSAPSQPSVGPRDSRLGAAGGGLLTPEEVQPVGSAPNDPYEQGEVAAVGAAPRRWWLLGGAVAVVVLLVLVTVLAWPRGSRAGEIVGTPIAAGVQPSNFDEFGGIAWIIDTARNSNDNDGNLLRVDVTTGATETFRIGGDPTLVAADRGAAFVVHYSGDILRVDAATGVQTVIPLPGGEVTAIEAGGGSVWVTGLLPDTVTRIDVATSAVSHIPVAGGPTALAIGEEYVYTVTTTPSQVVSISTSTGQVSGNPLPVNGAYTLQVVEGSIYVLISRRENPSDVSYTTVDEGEFVVSASSTPLRTLENYQWYAEFRKNSYWISDERADLIRHYSLAQGNPEEEPIIGAGKGVVQMRAVGDELWVLNAEDDTLTRYAVGD
ncbi:protein kinase domain-containing protein [Actinomycetospora sp. CA-101289]|uniref:protein kinase domain-containing protein n=1 Tax=Actinomycetospora sp. CA-101289 TaxID=3239893 RepID=UPI003D994327